MEIYIAILGYALSTISHAVNNNPLWLFCCYCCKEIMPQVGRLVTTHQPEEILLESCRQYYFTAFAAVWRRALNGMHEELLVCTEKEPISHFRVDAGYSSLDT